MFYEDGYKWILGTEFAEKKGLDRYFFEHTRYRDEKLNLARKVCYKKIGKFIYIRDDFFEFNKAKNTQELEDAYFSVIEKFKNDYEFVRSLIERKNGCKFNFKKHYKEAAKIYAYFRNFKFTNESENTLYIKLIKEMKDDMPVLRK